MLVSHPPFSSGNPARSSPVRSRQLHPLHTAQNRGIRPGVGELGHPHFGHHSGASIVPLASCGSGPAHMIETVIAKSLRALGRRFAAARGRHGAAPAQPGFAAPLSARRGAAQPGLPAARKPARRASTAATVDPAQRRADQALRGRRGASSRPSSTAWASSRSRHGLPGQRLLRAVQRTAAAVRPAQQPDPAGSGQSRPLLSEHPAAAGQQRRTRGPAPRDPGRARPERLRSAVSPICHRRPAAASSRTCSAAARIPGTRPDAPLVGYLPDTVRAHLRRLLLPDFLLHRAEQVRR